MSARAPSRSQLLEHAELALEGGDIQAAMEICSRALVADPRDDDALYLLGECQRELGQYEKALESWRRCVLQQPRRADAWAALGATFLQLLQMEEARRALNRAVREDPSNPDPWFDRGLLRERRKDFDGADRDFARAARLAPEDFPFPLTLTDAELEDAVEEAVDKLHPSLQDYLTNVAILVEEVPSDELLNQFDPPASPTEVLGYFSGHSLLDRSMNDPWSQLPSAIVLFRRNLQRFARDHQQLVEEVKTTIYHEVGHFLGLDEEDLEKRGLD